LELNQHQIHFSKFLEQLVIAVHIIAFISFYNLFIDIESRNQTMLDIVLRYFERPFRILIRKVESLYLVMNLFRISSFLLLLSFQLIFIIPLNENHTLSCQLVFIHFDLNDYFPRDVFLDIANNQMSFLLIRTELLDQILVLFFLDHFVERIPITFHHRHTTVQNVIFDFAYF